MSGAASHGMRRGDENENEERASSDTEIDCEEFQPNDGSGWRRYLKWQPRRAAAALVPVAPVVARKDAPKMEEANPEERGGGATTLAGQVMWKLAMRMSSHYESRLLQHISRSILNARSGLDEQHGEKKTTYHLQPQLKDDSDDDSCRGSGKKSRSSATATDCRRVEDSAKSSQHSSQSTPPSDPDAVSCPETGRPATSCTSAVAAGATSGGSGTGAALLPPFPPLVFSPTKGRAQKRARGMTLRQYVNWEFPGLRPGLSVRVVRCETVSAMPAVTEYVVHVVDLHTRVFWITKKRFSDFFLLRRKVRGMIRRAPEADDEEKDCLRFLLDLPFPRRRFRPAGAAAITRGMGEIEVFLRNVAALEPHSPLQRSLLMEFQLEMCSVEFVSSLEKIDTTGEPPEPKWLAYDLFRRLNSDGAVEGSTC
ncbi:hypothetical protein BBJ28_00006236, partial [Nothophytophthora sp. Chile5]